MSEQFNKPGDVLIREERERQILNLGYKNERDDQYIDGELRDAAICYAMQCDDIEGHWPWDKVYWKPSDDPIRNLVKAGALIAAEIDRLHRKNIYECRRIDQEAKSNT